MHVLDRLREGFLSVGQVSVSLRACPSMHVAFPQTHHYHLTLISMWHSLLPWKHVYNSVSTALDELESIVQQGSITLILDNI